jgi:hypothetical protein
VRNRFQAFAYKCNLYCYITVLNFDWHGNIKALGESKTVEGLWNALRSYLIEAGVSHGVCGGGSAGRPTGGGHLAGSANGELRGLGGGGGGKMTVKWQRGVLRYNCADSLDRTNLASYFAAIQVLAEQCNLLGLDIGSGGGGAKGSGSSSSSGGGGGSSNGGGEYHGAGTGSVSSPAASVTYGRRDSGATPSLPPGWESRLDTVTVGPVQVESS